MQKENIKIPQNDTSFFEIKKKKDYKNCIEILFDIEKDVDLINFFLILKSFVLNIKYMPIRILITLKENQENFNVVLNKDINFFKKIGYNNFVKWFTEQIENDKQYVKKNSVYSYIIIFNTKKDLEDITPLYPWRNEILKTFFKNIDGEINYESIIKKKDEYIKKLEEELKEFKK